MGILDKINWQPFSVEEVAELNEAALERIDGILRENWDGEKSVVSVPKQYVNELVSAYRKLGWVVWVDHDKLNLYIELPGRYK
jgi:hypothetical protein